MNKKQLIEKIAKDNDISKDKVEAIANSIFSALGKELHDGGVNTKIQILGFGTFEVRQRKAREGRNPRTGEKVKIPAMKTIGFKPSSALKIKG